jgi:DEAD/DEAH box helicase domain-containing protein
LLDELGLADECVRRFGWAARPGRTVDWPAWLPTTVVESLRAAGIELPWGHQVAAAEAAVSGHHVILTTGTASGKSLGFLLPVLTATYGGTDIRGPAPPGDRPVRPDLAGRGVDLDLGPIGPRPHTALYVAPTKALAHDQFRAARALGPPGWRIATLDGDTEPAARDWVRDWGTYVLSNPDMLHHSVLPQHRRWAPLLRTLRYVVIDEAHRYRGVFGAQVAAVLGRLRRLAHHYGADPVFVLAAATIAEPAETAGRLIGVPAGRIAVVDRDDSARPARELLMIDPDSDADLLTAQLLSRCVRSGRQTLAFAPSRRSAETIALRARSAVGAEAGGSTGSTGSTGSPPQIEAYRAGYLAGDRRQIETGLRTGAIRGVASTNALELGVDIAGLDAVLIDGYPGTRSSFWQQAGRAGRAEADALVVLIAGRHPLDRFLFAHPEVLLGRPVEASVLNPSNPYVLRPQLLAAARELALNAGDDRYFGPGTGGVIAELAAAGALRRRPGGWFPSGADGANRIDLRAAGRRLDIVESDTGRVIGVVDEAGADLSVHDGAVYVHRGDTYLCAGPSARTDVADDERDEGAGEGAGGDEGAGEGAGGDEAQEEDVPEVLVRAAQPGYLTSPRRETTVRILAEHRCRAVGAGRVAFGEVEVRSRVTGYLRRDPVTGTVWDQTPLDLPTRTTRTAAVWLTLDAALVDEQIGLSRLEAGAHAAEHAWLNLLPAYAACDPWDVSGTCAVRHPDTGLLTVLGYDVSAGGAGFAEHGFAVAEAWLGATADLLRDCDCTAGCPSCIVSASCGTTGRPLDKTAGEVLLGLLTAG